MDRPLHRLKSFFRSIFEPKKKNPISLRDDENLDSHHKILKVGDKNTPISLKNDAVDVQGDLTVNGVSVSTEPEVGTITALNNATENELVTVGATTTELDAETNLTFDGSNLKITNTLILTPQLQCSYDGSNHFKINVLNTGATVLTATGTAADMTLQASGDCINFNDGSNLFGEINMGTASIVKLLSATDYDVSIESQGTGDVILTSSSGDISSTSGTASKPELLLQNVTADASGPILNFTSQRGASAVDAVDGDVLGTINFTGYDDGTPSTHTYARIVASAEDTLTNEEKGNLIISISSKDGNLYEACKFLGNSVAGGAIATILDGPLYLKEPSTGAAEADMNNYGQIWAKNDTPTSLYFTGDTGVDVQLTDGAEPLGQVKVATRTISEAQMNALHTTEQVLVAAQGAGKVIIPLKVVFFVDRDASTAQSGTGNMFVSMDGSTSIGAGSWGFIKRFMWNESGDRIIQLHQGIGDEVAQADDFGDNLSLTAKVSSAITSGSIDSVKVVTTYYVFDNS